MEISGSEHYQFAVCMQLVGMRKKEGEMSFSAGSGTVGRESPWWVILIVVYLFVLGALSLIAFLVRMRGEKDDDYP
jgi:hypothetical protein